MFQSQSSASGHQSRSGTWEPSTHEASAAARSKRIDSDSKEEDAKDYYKRCRKNSEYKINVYIANFYGGMHVEEILDWISDVENFFQYMEIPQDNWVACGV